MKAVKVIKVVSFTLILVMALLCVNNIVMYKAPYGITQYRGFYEQEKNSVGVLFVGTSHVYSDIDPAYIYDECGILSYDLATGGASIAATYYSIAQALEYQHPSVIAVELFGITRNDMQQREIVDATYCIRNPRIKYASLKSNIGNNSLIEFYMAFPWYHTLYNDVTRNDFVGYDHIQNIGTISFLYPSEELQMYKGATILSCTTPGISADISCIEYESEIDDKVEMYLNKIIQLCKENDIELCFIVSPFMGISENFCAQINYVRANIAVPNDVYLIDANRYTQDIGIDWSTDAAESSHLNYKGAEKYSRWLSRQLADLYKLQDCHGTETAESWEKNLDWQNRAYLVFKLLETDGIEDNISIWNELRADVFISFNGNQRERYKDIFLCLIGLVEEEGKTADGLVMTEGVWKIHYFGDTEMVTEEGIDTVSISSSEQGAVINSNGNYYIKTSEGINIVVYDNCIGDIIDYTSVTDLNGLVCVK